MKRFVAKVISRGYLKIEGTIHVLAKNKKEAKKEVLKILPNYRIVEWKIIC